MNGIAQMYMNIAQQNEIERQQIREQLASIVPQAAAFGRQMQQDKYANRLMNTIDPPRAAAVNPESPEALVANAQFGGPTAPHTGGEMEASALVDQLKWERQMEEDELNDTLKRAQLENIYARTQGVGGYAPKTPRGPDPQKLLNYNQDLENDRYTKFKRGLELGYGLSPEELGTSTVAPDQNGVAPGKVRVVIPPKIGQYGIPMGDPRTVEMPKALLDQRDQFGAIDELPVSTAGIADEANALFGQVSDQPLPAEVNGDPAAEAEGIREMVKRGAITKEEAIAKLRAIGFK